MMQTVHEKVARQYEAWVYPLPVMDLSAPGEKERRNGADPHTRYHVYWPHLPFRDDLDILVAGCGSNAAARYAYQHPKANITGIDLSTSSLDHETYLKEKHQLDNLSLHHCPIEAVSSLGKTFDFIDVSGVLHHLPDPVTGLKALSGVLRPDGVIAIMVYGQYGRAGVYMMQELFQIMKLGQTESDLAIVKNTLASLPGGHVVKAYLNRAEDTRYDAGLVDTFLHPQDRAYTVKDCQQLASDAGMAFMGWWDNILYYPEGQLAVDSPLLQQINTLPEQDIWRAMELYNDTLGQHSFCVCHPERPQSTYRPNFEDDILLTYIPVLQSQIVSDNGQHIKIQRKPYPVYNLQPAASALYRQIDGSKTISECFDEAQLELPAKYNKLSACAEIFQCLWRLGYIHLKMPVTSSHAN